MHFSIDTEFLQFEYASFRSYQQASFLSLYRSPSSVLPFLRDVPSIPYTPTLSIHSRHEQTASQPHHNSYSVATPLHYPVPFFLTKPHYQQPPPLSLHFIATIIPNSHQYMTRSEEIPIPDFLQLAQADSISLHICQASSSSFHPPTASAFPTQDSNPATAFLLEPYPYPTPSHSRSKPITWNITKTRYNHWLSAYAQLELNLQCSGLHHSIICTRRNVQKPMPPEVSQDIISLLSSDS